MVSYKVLIFATVLVSITGQPLEILQNVISNTIQTVKQQKSEISQVGDFWTTLVTHFMYEGIAQATQECVDSLGDKCTSDKLKQIADCVNSSTVKNDVTAALSAFVNPLMAELDGIEKDLGNSSTDIKIVDKDIESMNLSRTDEESFVYRKNKAQSQFIVDVNPIVNLIPQIASKCLASLIP
ncbi:hypothetical protein GE061_009301 [Apolygus lucorum]|uniref:Protein TsetseEP domain-containing protein n=1 Tax=Apolygus lucorum TaxID=248454 RepID=A0A6A4KG24_APOLU|nr:hypothetical protein GE061_009301 [Apolygus lucorum]